jgi:hypothetical protein
LQPMARETIERADENSRNNRHPRSIRV